MTWIDDDNEERKRLNQSLADLAIREAKIANEAAAIYEELWAELAGRIKEANEKRITELGLLTNGGGYERKIVVPVRAQRAESSRNPDEYVLRLGKKHQSITLTGARGTNQTIALDLGDDEVVRPKLDGELKTIKEVARTLLRPLLFPEMYGQK